MSKTLNTILATTLMGGVIGGSIAIDRNLLIPYQQARQVWAENISNPDVSGRVIQRLNGFWNDDNEYFVREYHILTGEGKEVWGILPTLIQRNGKYEPSLINSKGDFDPGKLPRDVFKVGQDVRLQFSGKSKIPANQEWINTKDDYGEKIPNPQVNPIMEISRFQITEPAKDADNGDYASRVGMVVHRSFQRHNGQTENVLLEEYTLLDKNGQTQYFVKKHPLPQNTNFKPKPLLDLGRMVSITWEQFSLDGEIYYQKEKDEYGTRTKKIVHGIGPYQAIRYSQSDRTPKGIVKYLLPYVGLRPDIKSASTAR